MDIFRWGLNPSEMNDITRKSRRYISILILFIEGTEDFDLLERIEREMFNEAGGDILVYTNLFTLVDRISDKTGHPPKKIKDIYVYSVYFMTVLM